MKLKDKKKNQSRKKENIELKNRKTGLRIKHTKTRTSGAQRLWYCIKHSFNRTDASMSKLFLISYELNVFNNATLYETTIAHILLYTYVHT